MNVDIKIRDRIVKQVLRRVSTHGTGRGSMAHVLYTLIWKRTMKPVVIVLSRGRRG
jgi:hypothetical protein